MVLALPVCQTPPNLQVLMWWDMIPTCRGEFLTCRLSFSTSHPWKAPFPRCVTESGMLTHLRALQPLKARSPMEVTESGMHKIFNPCSQHPNPLKRA